MPRACQLWIFVFLPTRSRLSPRSSISICAAHISHFSRRRIKGFRAQVAPTAPGLMGCNNPTVCASATAGAGARVSTSASPSSRWRPRAVAPPRYGLQYTLCSDVDAGSRGGPVECVGLHVAGSRVVAVKGKSRQWATTRAGDREPESYFRTDWLGKDRDRRHSLFCTGVCEVVVGSHTVAAACPCIMAKVSTQRLCTALLPTHRCWPLQPTALSWSGTWRVCRHSSMRSSPTSTTARPPKKTRKTRSSRAVPEPPQAARRQHTSRPSRVPRRRQWASAAV